MSKLKIAKNAIVVLVLFWLILSSLNLKNEVKKSQDLFMNFKLERDQYKKEVEKLKTKVRFYESQTKKNDSIIRAFSRRERDSLRAILNPP